MKCSAKKPPEIHAIIWSYNKNFWIHRTSNQKWCKKRRKFTQIQRIYVLRNGWSYFSNMKNDSDFRFRFHRSTRAPQHFQTFVVSEFVVEWFSSFPPALICTANFGNYVEKHAKRLRDSAQNPSEGYCAIRGQRSEIQKY